MYPSYSPYDSVLVNTQASFVLTGNAQSNNVDLVDATILRMGGSSSCSTDGTWYLPLDMAGQQRTVATPAGCQKRCRDTTGCWFFNNFPNGGCHITTGASGTASGGGNPTAQSGSVQCGQYIGTDGSQNKIVFSFPGVTSKGICDWHYEDEGSISLQACADKCEATTDCRIFSMSAAHGCRVSKCGADPGPNPCPADKQCPRDVTYDGKIYSLSSAADKSLWTNQCATMTNDLDKCVSAAAWPSGGGGNCKVCY